METVDSVMKSLDNLRLMDKSSMNASKPDTEVYVTDVDVQSCGADPLVAAACSNFTISLRSMKNLAHISTISGHTDTVTKVKFGKADPSLVYSCSNDKTVRCWDTRLSPSKEVHLFQAPKVVMPDILSLDISQTDRLLCASTEKVGNDSYLLFWDNRQRSLLGCYSECHQDDITQVCFQPGSDRYLVSGSADGLVCTFDLQETSEDDALQITTNAESDVARVGWCGRGSVTCVYCVTSDNSFHIWDAQEGNSCCALDGFSGIQEDEAESYIVDCIADLTTGGDSSSAVLLTGNHSGQLQLALCCSDKKADRRTLLTLEAGHTATVRCCLWHGKTQTLLTGGEDGLLCLWSASSGTQFSSKGKEETSQGKVKVKTNVMEHSRKPYSKKKK